MYFQKVPRNCAPWQFSHSINHFLQLYQFSDQLKKVKPCQDTRMFEYVKVLEFAQNRQCHRARTLSLSWIHDDWL